MLTDHGAKECKRHDLAEEKLQRARDKRNEDRMKREKNEAKVYINNADEAKCEYCRVFGKKKKPLPPDPELSDFYHPSETQKNGE